MLHFRYSRWKNIITHEIQLPATLLSIQIVTFEVWEGDEKVDEDEDEDSSHKQTKGEVEDVGNHPADMLVSPGKKRNYFLPLGK